MKPVTSDDLVDTEGRCAGVPFGPDPNLPMGQQDNIPMIPTAVALDMTECDVVKRAGQPGQVNFGTNERGERTVVLTYLGGARPGIYRFASGRLTSIERGAGAACAAQAATARRQPRAHRRHQARS